MLVRMCRKGILCTLLTGLQIGTVIMENSIEIPQKFNVKIPYDLAVPLLHIYPKEIKTHKSCPK